LPLHDDIEFPIDSTPIADIRSEASAVGRDRHRDRRQFAIEKGLSRSDCRSERSVRKLSGAPVLHNFGFPGAGPLRNWLPFAAFSTVGAPQSLDPRNQPHVLLLGKWLSREASQTLEGETVPENVANSRASAGKRQLVHVRFRRLGPDVDHPPILWLDSARPNSWFRVIRFSVTINTMLGNLPSVGRNLTDEIRSSYTLIANDAYGPGYGILRFIQRPFAVHDDILGCAKRAASRGSLCHAGIGDVSRHVHPKKPTKSSRK